MNAHQLYIYGELLAANARVEGMVADNQCRVACGDSPAYIGQHFQAESQHMQDLARQVLDSEVTVSVDADTIVINDPFRYAKG